MIEEKGIRVRRTSKAAELSIRPEVFAVKADLNLSDSACAFEAYGLPCDFIEVWMRTSASSSTKERRVIRDSAQAGREIADWIRELNPPPVREVFEGGPFSNR